MVRGRATGRGQRRARRARGHRSDRGPRRRVSEELVRLLGADPALAGTTATYLAIIVAVLPVGAVGDTVENCFTAYGDTRAVLHVSVVSVLVNLVAARPRSSSASDRSRNSASRARPSVPYSPALSDSFTYSRTPRGSGGTRSGSPATRSPSISVVREVVAVGLPLGGQRGVSELVRVLVVSLVAIAGGAAGVAAYTVGARVATLAVVPALGMQQAAQSMIGQNLGADAPHRARRTTMVGTKLVVVGFLALGAVQFLFAGAIADLRAPTSPRPAGRYRCCIYGFWRSPTGRSAGPTPCSPASTALRAPEPRSSRI